MCLCNSLTLCTHSCSICLYEHLTGPCHIHINSCKYVHVTTLPSTTFPASCVEHPNTYTRITFLQSCPGQYSTEHAESLNIRESVDSLCRDGADTPIVPVHRKAFLTRERSRSKPFWAPSYSIPVVLYPPIPPKYLKCFP